MRLVRVLAALMAAAALPGAERPSAPLLELRDAQGAKRSLVEYAGSVVVLNFWATWCRSCRAEVSWLDDLQRDYAQRRVAVIGVAMDDRGWPAVTPFLAGRKISYPVLLGNPRIARHWGGLESLPVTVFLDRCGRIAARHNGVLAPEQLRRVVDLLLAEKPACSSPAFAQSGSVSTIR